MLVIKIIYIILYCNKGVTLRIHWSNYTFYEVTAYNARERALLYSLNIRNDSVIFYNWISNEAALPMNVLVNNCCTLTFEDMLSSVNIQFSYGSSEYLDQHYAVLDNNGQDPSKAFFTWEAILKWADRVERKYPFTEKKTIAVTYNKKEIFLMKISRGRKKPAVFVSAGEDAKDWTSTAVIINYINTLVHSKPLLTLLDHYELYFIPVCNPDGYKYSMLTDKFWSKNRKAFFPKKRCPNGKYATGVNIDRNWFAHKTSLYDSDDECNAVYIGHQTLTEEESKAIYTAVNTLAVKLIAFINVKGFGRMITIPYAHSAYSNNHNLMMEILLSVTDKLQTKHNATFYYGTTAHYLYNYTSNSADWVKDKLNIPMVYTIHLQKEDNFIPNHNDIPELTCQFITIFNETLMLAKDIYGPLFNNQVKNTLNNVNFIKLISILFIMQWCYIYK